MIDAKIIPLVHALDPQKFQCVQSTNERKIDIGCRAHKYVWYLGDTDRESILEYFSNAPSISHLNEHMRNSN